MKLLGIIFIGAILSAHQITAIAGPIWHYDEQSEWGATEDTSVTTIPHKYPYALCGLGKNQSPIDLAAAEISNARRLNDMEIWYDADTPAFFNNGHTIQVNTSDNFKGELKIGEESYPLIQFHFHEPSEHVLGDTKFPAEVHFVYIGNDGRIVVLGVAINIGEENTTFQTILDNMPLQEGEPIVSSVQINPASLLPSISHQQIDYLTFAGSLTTPPCSEGVQWYLLTQAISISARQYEELKKFHSDNARSPQDLNVRVVQSTE